MINIKFRGCFFPSQLVITRWTWANKKRGNCSVSSSLFLCMLCFLLGQKQCSQRWLVVCFLRNETQMKFKCAWGFVFVGHLWLNDCPSIFKVWKFYYFLFSFCFIDQWMIWWICFIPLELFGVHLYGCCLSRTCGCKTTTFWFLFFWFYTFDALLSITYMWL